MTKKITGLSHSLNDEIQFAYLDLEGIILDYISPTVLAMQKHYYLCCIYGLNTQFR